VEVLAGRTLSSALSTLATGTRLQGSATAAAYTAGLSETFPEGPLAIRAEASRYLLARHPRGGRQG
jgi:hypothetical protein